MKDTLLSKFSATKILLYALMYSLAAVCLIPLIWMVRTAFTPKELTIDLFAIALPTIDNFKRVLNAVPFYNYYWNTIFMVFTTLVIQFVFSTLAAYAFGRLEFKFKNLLFTLVMVQLMITPDVLIFPNYQIIAKFGLTNTKIGIMLPFFSSAFGIFFLRQHIKTIPIELEEAAKMEGCSMLKMIWHIYVPLLKPTYIAFGLVSASYQWNNFLWPLVMIDSVKNRPLTVGLAIFAQSYETGSQWSDVCAATFLVTAPLLIVLLLFQNQFIEGFTNSGIK